jgi:hypothetical protein
MACRTWSVAEGDGRVRQAAFESLRTSYRRDRADIGTFGGRAHADPDPQVRAAALGALVEGRPREPGVKELVRALAESDPGPGAREAARMLFADAWG